MSIDTTYTIAGMTCGSCCTKVTEAVVALEGVTDTDIDLATGTLTVTGDVAENQIREAVAAAGYQVS